MNFAAKAVIESTERLVECLTIEGSVLSNPTLSKITEIAECIHRGIGPHNLYYSENFRLLFKELVSIEWFVLCLKNVGVAISEEWHP